jgi:hypothetical protein
MSTTTAAPDGAALGPLGIGAVRGVLFSPASTFAALAKRPQWLGPFLFVLACVIAGSWISLGTTLEFSREAAASAMDRMGVPEADRDEALARMPDADDRSPGTLAQHVGGGAGTLVVFFFLGAGLLHALTRLAGQPVEFRSTLALYSAAHVIEGLGHLVKSALMQASGTVEIALSPAALLPEDVGFHSRRAILLDLLDVFSVWNLLVLVVGARAMWGAARPAAIGICGTYWVLKALFIAGARIFGAWMMGML